MDTYKMGVFNAKTRFSRQFNKYANLSDMLGQIILANKWKKLVGVVCKIEK